MNSTTKFRFVILTFFVLLFHLHSTAQLPPPERCWTYGFNFGMVGFAPSKTVRDTGTAFFQRTLNYGYGSVIDVDGGRHLALLANTSIGLHGGFMWRDKNKEHYTSIGVEVQRNKACYTFDPPFYFTNQGDTFAKWVQTDKYLRYGISIQRNWYLDENSRLGGSRYFYIREAFSQTVLHSNFGTPFVPGAVENWTENGTGMVATVLSSGGNTYMISSEIGFKHFETLDKYSVDLGLVYHAPFVSSFTEQYEFYKNNVLQGRSRVTYNGGTITLNLRYSFNSFLPEKPVREPEPRDTVKPVVVHKDTLAGRSEEVQATYSAYNDKVRIKVWDRDEIDGDIITLYFNGEAVLNNYTLKGRKKRITLKLKPGSNTLVMHAENLGTKPPNTAAFEMNDGRRKRNLTLTSDDGKSGAIEIIRK